MTSRRRIKLLFLACAALVAAFGGERHLAELVDILQPPAEALTPSEVRVLRVVDGDTIKVALQGRNDRIRLIGIDTPESRANDKARRDSKRSHESVKKITKLGQSASQFVAELIPPGTVLRVEFDVDRKDKYDRLLVYAYLPSGEMLNEKIIASGYAYPMTFPPNVRYVSRFQRAFQAAKQHKRGLWAER